MATTRLIIHHISKGETIAQSLADRFDYGQNPDKTQQGELISSYQCDAETADAEFLLSKAKYKAITGREQKKDADILCYQIRQSFVPGEITPEEANRIGYETAMRWTKGKYQSVLLTVPEMSAACYRQSIARNACIFPCFLALDGRYRTVRFQYISGQKADGGQSWNPKNY